MWSTRLRRMSRGAHAPPREEIGTDRRICLWLSILCSESAMISIFSVCILMTCQTFFNTAPFHGKNEYQIIRLVTKGTRPERLNSPAIDNGVWELIELCWKHHASERPTMQKIVETMAPFAPLSFSSTPPLPPASATATSLSEVLPALLASLNKVCTFKHQCTATDKS